MSLYFSFESEPGEGALSDNKSEPGEEALSDNAVCQSTHQVCVGLSTLGLRTSIVNI